jgi:ligand-binding SRPBCC domain-containing protein
MTRVETTVMIEAPIESVYEFASDWRNFPRYFTYIREVRPLTDENLGQRAELALKVKFRGLSLNSLWQGVGEVSPAGWAFDAKLMGRWARKTWTLLPVGNGTRLTFTLDYTMPPIPVLAGLMDRLWMKPGWQRIYAASFANLKKLMEADSRRAAADTGEPSPA